jgi:hypothetical protein
MCSFYTNITPFYRRDLRIHGFLCPQKPVLYAYQGITVYMSTQPASELKDYLWVGLVFLLHSPCDSPALTRECAFVLFLILCFQVSASLSFNPFYNMSWPSVLINFLCFPNVMTQFLEHPSFHDLSCWKVSVIPTPEIPTSISGPNAFTCLLCLCNSFSYIVLEFQLKFTSSRETPGTPLPSSTIF